MSTPPFPETVSEDETIVVLNKPSDVLAIPDRYDRSAPNLYSILDKRYGEIYVVHRIDKETSGLILFAKTRSAHALLSQQFEQRQISKLYLAICGGESGEDDGIIELPIAESSHKRGRVKIDPKHRKASTTDISVVERFEGYVYVEALLESGRTAYRAYVVCTPGDRRSDDCGTCKSERYESRSQFPSKIQRTTGRVIARV